ncbi:hypothetical protein D3C84_1316180 [compost metagenome]
MHQGIDGKADEHHAAGTGDPQFIAGVEGTYVTGTDNCNKNHISQQAAEKAQRNQRWQH